MTSRRRFLRGLGAGAALPFLDAFRPTRAHAAGQPGPKRLVVVHYPQGTVLPMFVPTGTETDWTLSPILAPLAPLQDRVTVVTGVDNVMPDFNTSGNAHENANYTFLTGQPFPVQQDGLLTAAGPTIEQEIAARIDAPTPFQRLDFAIGGSETADGILASSSGSFWYGPDDPVASFNDPRVALARIFGEGGVSPEDAWALRARRASVLGGVLDSFASLRRNLGSADRARLEAHEAKLIELEGRIVAGTGECSRPDLSLPPTYRYGLDDDVSAPVMNELLTTALSCDLTRVATLDFGHGDGPEFRFLWGRNGGEPIVDTALWDRWHTMVHADYQPGMEIAYHWYMEMFADLLTRMDAAVDADGDNLLDTSLVVCLSEFSSGRHWNTTLPIVLAGNLGCGRDGLGRWLDFLSEAPENVTGYTPSGITTNQLFVSLLHAFGLPDETFGFTDATLPTGPLPGLLG